MSTHYEKSNMNAKLLQGVLQMYYISRLDKVKVVERTFKQIYKFTIYLLVFLNNCLFQSNE